MGREGLDAMTRLDASEVSLVRRGANKKKRFPIFKSEEEDMSDNQEVLKAVLETEIDGEETLKEYFEKAKVSDKGIAAVKGALRILSSFKDEMPGDIMGKLAAIAGYKQEKQEEEPPMYPEPKDKKKIKKWLDEMPEDLRKQFELKEESEEEPVKKEDLPEEVQKAMEDQDKKLADMQAENEKINKALEAEKDKRELEEWTAKARTDLGHFPGKSAEELGQMLKDLNDANPEVAKTQFDSMKAASEAMKSSELLTEAGVIAKSGLSGSTWEKVNKMADNLVEKSEDLGMTKEKAITKVLDNRPDLYEKYLEEHPRQVAPSV